MYVGVRTINILHRAINTVVLFRRSKILARNDHFYCVLLVLSGRRSDDHENWHNLVE